MCGFVSVVTGNQRFSLETLIAMRDRMDHRGPDGAGAQIEKTGSGFVGLGHRRLSILDLSPAGAQPMESHDKNCIIVFNGEIYNYIELAQELRDLGCVFRSGSDTEVLLAAYKVWGYDCLPKLNGMFAFSIWDRNQGTLFVARDRFGEKPLYYTKLSSGGVAFASEVKALFAHPDVTANWEQSKVDEFLLHGKNSYGGEETFFCNIYRLPAAHALIVDAAGNEVRRWRYWTPDYNDVRPIAKWDDTVEQFADLLIKSVEMRMRTDVHVGACLSGGLDSSALVGLVSKMKKGGNALFSHTYSARFDSDPTISEGAYIDVMRDYTGLSAQSVTPDPLRMAAESERLHWHQEQPFLSASMYLEWCVTRKARETGTIVMLDGQGADELLAGYQYHMRRRQYDQFARGDLLGYYKNTSLFGKRIRTEALRYQDASRRIDTSAAYDFSDVLSMLKKGVGDANAYRHLTSGMAGIPKVTYANSLRHGLAMGMLYDTLPNNLHSADCNGMAHSIETRFPFLDYNLVDWSIKLPDNALVRDGWLKYILRSALKDIVPDSIRWRVDKVGFAAPQDLWMRGALKAWVSDNLFEGPITKQPVYDRGHVEFMWNAHKSGESDFSSILWRYVTMNEWLRLFEGNVWKRGFFSHMQKQA